MLPSVQGKSLAAINKRCCFISIILFSVAMLVLWIPGSFTYSPLNISSESLSPLINRLKKNNSSSQDTADTNGISNTLRQVSSQDTADTDGISNTLRHVSSQDTADTNGILNTLRQVSSQDTADTNGILNTLRHVSSQDTADTNGILNTLRQVSSQDTADKNKSGIKVLSNKRIVIVLAYMRTGSTLTASLLQEYKKTFYVFEPIRSIYEAFRSKNVTLKYLNGTKKHYFNFMKSETVLNELQSWLTCQIGNINIESLTDRFHTLFTKYMKGFNKCYETARKKHTQDATNQCLAQVITQCQNAPLIVLKIIRMKMSTIIKLLPYFPNMKILQLVRDPRGILNSREKLNMMYAPKNVLGHCDLMQTDLNTTQSIQQIYPDRVKIVFYEDMAERPLDTSKAISEFSGIEFTDHMRDYIKSKTSATRDSGRFTTARKNSTKVASKWRTTLDPKYARFIYTSCESSNKYLGYLPLISAVDQRNSNIPSRQRLDKGKNNMMLIV